MNRGLHPNNSDDEIEELDLSHYMIKNQLVAELDHTLSEGFQEPSAREENIEARSNSDSEEIQRLLLLLDEEEQATPDRKIQATTISEEPELGAIATHATENSFSSDLEDGAIRNTQSAEQPVLQTLAFHVTSGLPDGFSLNQDGVYLVETTAAHDVEEKYLCSQIRVIDLFRSRAGFGWGRRVSVTNLDGKETIVAILDEELEAKGQRFLSRLVGLGLRFGKISNCRSHVLQLLRNWNPKERKLSTYRQGWADNECDAFVMGNGQIIGNPDVVQVNDDVSKLGDAFLACGSLEDWKKNVAALCLGNSLMTTAVSLAFVGPLLELLGRDGGGLHLRGASSQGKTTLLRAAASVWGTPKLVQSWRTTANALESTAAAANGMLLVLDELGEATAQDLDQAAYMLANGKAKARSNAAGQSMPPASWKLALLSSGEVSVADKLAQIGRRTQAGQEVRLINVAADRNTFGAFDALHGCENGAAFAKLVADRSNTSCGTAGPAFVEWLLRDRTKGLALVRDVQCVFEKLVHARCAPHLDGTTRRTLDWFSLIAAAGHLATLAGCTDWSKNHAVTSTADVVVAWLDQKATDDHQLSGSAVERMRGFLKSNENTFELIGKFGAAGASSLGWQDDKVFYVPGITWRLIFDDIDGRAAASQLERAGFLNRADAANWMWKTPASVPGRPRAYAVKKRILEDSSTVQRPSLPLS